MNRPSLDSMVARDNFVWRRVLRFVFLTALVFGAVLLGDVGWDMMRAKPGHYIPQHAQIWLGAIIAIIGALGIQHGDARAALQDAAGIGGTVADTYVKVRTAVVERAGRRATDPPVVIPPVVAPAPEPADPSLQQMETDPRNEPNHPGVM